MVIPIEQEGKVGDTSSLVENMASQGASSSGRSRKAGGKRTAGGSQQVCRLVGGGANDSGEVLSWLARALGFLVEVEAVVFHFSLVSARVTAVPILVSERQFISNSQ